MSNIPISSLPVAVALDGSEIVPIVQGGTTKRTTADEIAALSAAGFVPLTRAINTPLDSGLTGGGALATDLNLRLDVNNLVEKVTPTGADFLAINDSVGNTPAKVSPANFYKTISALTHKPVPMGVDEVPIYSIADAAARYSTVTEILAAAGSLPGGGTTGQPLIKRSNANFDTEFATLPVVGGGTGAITLTNHGVLLGQGTNPVVATAAMSGGQLLIGQTGADPSPETVTGDVTISAAGVTTIGSNKVTNGMLRQSAGLSVIGNATDAAANVADITAANDFEILRRSGTALGFGSIDLSQANAVGSSILGAANGGTGVNNGTSTLTLGGSLTTVGAFTAQLTFTGNTAVTFPTSGTLATTGGPALPSVAQGDLLFGSATNVLSTLAKNTTASRYLSNTGTSNNPAWAQVNLANGVAGTLPVGNGGTGVATLTTYALIAGGTTGTGAVQQVGVGSAGQALLSNGASALPTFQSIASVGPVTQVTTASSSITGGTPAVAVVRAAPTATTLTLPTVASQGNVPLHIFDWSSSVTGHTITLTPNGSETIMTAATFTLFSNAASLAGVTLYPSTTLGGWYIAP